MIYSAGGRALGGQEFRVEAECDAYLNWLRRGLVAMLALLVVVLLTALGLFAIAYG